MLDFDGPVCSVFAGLPAPGIAEQLRNTLRRLGVPVTAELEDDDDPLSIYRYSTNGGPAVVAAIHDALVAAELRAVETATPTPGAVDVIDAAHERGRRLAVVSNNAAAAVATYLRLHGLTGRVDYIAARRTPEPSLMKPSPHYLIEAAATLDVSIRTCALVGDSGTDAVAAKRAGAYAVGYANKSGKGEQLVAAGAAVVIDSMTTLATVVREARGTPYLPGSVEDN
ncbi:HAD family hydrolase [Jiangella alba]|nr:HAD family hydrolase [Jiangella alba]